MKNKHFAVSIFILLFLIFSCAKSENPVLPVSEPAPGAQSNMPGAHLWGLWDVRIDPLTETVEAIPFRGIAFAANVTKMLDSVPSTLLFEDLALEPDTGIVELDVGIMHPLTGATQFTGFDVIGVFMGNGPGVYLGADGVPVISEGATVLTNADGYTRWFNAPEFTGAGEIKPLFGYVPGKYGAPACDPAAILNPYKFFADGLGPDESAYDYLIENPEMRGSFAPDNMNFRHYSMVFPKLSTEGARFQYAIVANWAPNANFPNPPDSMDDWPPNANAGESLVVKIEDLSNAFYEDATCYGGNAVLKISALDWSAGCDGVQEEYEMWVHSPAWDGPFEVDMSCNGGAWNGSAYVADIPVDNIENNDPFDVWIEIRYPMVPYSGNSGVPNDANGPIATYHYHKLQTLLTTPGPCSYGWAESWGFFGADQAYGIVIDKMKNVFITGNSRDIMVGDEIVMAKYDRCGNLKWGYRWGGFSNDVAYDITTDSSGNIYITGKYGGVMDMNPGAEIDYRTGSGLFIIKFSNTGDYLWANTFEGSTADTGYAIAYQESGQIYVSGIFYGTVDFDPGPGEDLHTSGGSSDCFLLKLNQDGTFVWAKTWGDYALDHARGVTVDWTGKVYVTGDYRGIDVDFDPGPSEDLHSFNGGADAFISHYDQNGNYQWTKTWGSANGDYPEDISMDGYGNVHITGEFNGTVDFDPGPGVDEHIALGGTDGFLTKFDSTGEHLWVRTWGVGWLNSNSVTVDSIGNCYVTGDFSGSLQLSAGGPPIECVGGRDIYIARWNPTGDLAWGRGIGGQGEDKGLAISLDNNGNPYAAGSFEDSAEFAPVDPPCNNSGFIQISYGSSDIFTTMMFPDGCW